MKIDDSTGKLPPLPGPAGRNTVARAEGQTVEPASDKVSLSGSGKVLAGAAEAPIDLAKVEKVRAAIAEGNFTVDAERIADNVIASNRELLRRS